MISLKPLLATAGLSVVLAASAAIAQPYPQPYDDSGPYADGYAPPPPDAYAPPTSVPGVTVYAPRIVGRSAIGAPIEVHSEHVVVPVADLDLSTGWGMDALRFRIRRAASDACQDLDDRYPVSADNGDDCYGQAVRRAFSEVAYQTGYAP